MKLKIQFLSYTGPHSSAERPHMTSVSHGGTVQMWHDSVLLALGDSTALGGDNLFILFHSFTLQIFTEQLLCTCSCTEEVSGMFKSTDFAIALGKAL